MTTARSTSRIVRRADQGAAITAIDFAANNAEVAGGEDMLLRMAAVARSIGLGARVIGPTYASDLGDAAAKAGLPFVGIPGRDRRTYLARLAWTSKTWTSSLVWCNGLVPALATSLCRAPRVVHLHQLPTGNQRRVLGLATFRADALVVPSQHLADALPGSTVLENWTDDPAAPTRRVLDGEPVVVGAIGRLSTDKGIDVLARAAAMLHERSPGRYRLCLAGDDRFVPPDDAAVVQRALTRVADITTLLGWVDPARFFDQIDIAVVPSVWDEPFGLGATDAMARRIPLVVSRAGALPAVVGAEHPWVVARGDALALADAIEAIAAVADRDRNEVVAQVERARARWEQRFSPTSGTERFAALVRDLGVALP